MSNRYDIPKGLAPGQGKVPKTAPPPRSSLYGDKIMCQLCFGGFWKNELWKDAHGDYWDVCKQCKAEEYRQGLFIVKNIIMNNYDQDDPVQREILQRLQGFWNEI